MGLFPDDESRDRATREMSQGFYTWRMVPILILHGVAVWCVFFLLTFAIRRTVPSLAPHGASISVLLTLAVYTMFIVVALRRDQVRDLRSRLIEAGVAVCMKCGYDLRGLPAGSDRCPECGVEFEADPAAKGE
jgi:tRNA(Ile2) C34 agmatinyltransferase TiaS